MFKLPIIEFVFMVGIDLLFIAVLILVMLPLGIYRQAAFAVMKRNFVGYFSNPTGYVFLCLFVLLTSFAAFWPHEFFTTNLANFDQLNRFLPYIMLVFIPAITMSIWAEERQQHTDELLLTLPAQDIDIVIGKYFAAVLVFTVSLIFSQLSNYAVLIAMTGGSLDSGLLFSTYLGYWFVGVAMLAIGMVASFLTSNLTVSFIFGVVFNAPLAFFSNADVILPNSRLVSTLYDWSLLQRFEPFGRGLISLASVAYFLGLVIIGIYVSILLIGRRHWLGGRDGNSLLGHYVLRSIFLVLTAVATVLIVQHSPLNRIRLDVSQEKVSTLSDNTKQLLRMVSASADSPGQPLPPITIDAYVGNTIPTDFVQTKYDLVNLLREFDVMGGNRVKVNLHTGVEPFSEESINAEKRFGIRPVRYVSETRGALREEEVILGAAFTSGLQRVVVPFFWYGMPVEYELIRSINTVAQSQRKTIGIARTDALVTGDVINVNNQALAVPKLQIITELEKQYDVQDVDLNEAVSLWIEDENGQPLERRYDVLLVVQPSKMSPEELSHLIEAIRGGQPTLVFEDPFPTLAIAENVPRVLGTPAPRRIARYGTSQSCRIRELWDVLGLDLPGRKVQPAPGTPDQDLVDPYLVWQDDNPYKRNPLLNEKEQVIIYDDARQMHTHFNSDHQASAGVSELLFRYSGLVMPKRDTPHEFIPLVVAGPAGRILMQDWVRAQSEEHRDLLRGSESGDYFLAAHIRGVGSEAAPASNGAGSGIDCIYVADIDILGDEFVHLRNQPRQNGIEYRFQDMSFVLNLIDSLANQENYIAIRDRRPRHVTLRYVEETTRQVLDQVDEETEDFHKIYAAAVSEAQENALREIRALQTDVGNLKKRQEEGENIDVSVLEAKERLLAQVQREQGEKLLRKTEQLDNERREKIRTIRLDAERDIQRIQRRYKLAAVLIPPIPPLLLGLIVFTRRRLREREGISKARRIR